MEVPFGQRSSEPENLPSHTPRRPTDGDEVLRIATEHLPDDVRTRWLDLLRPAVRLVPAPAGDVRAGDRHGDEPEVGRLGGIPALPHDVTWPTWEGHGPLSYIGELHCGPLSAFDLDIRLPAGGRLLFFYFDGAYDNYAATVGTWDPETLAGARVVYLPDTEPATVRSAPEGLVPFPERRYVGRAVLTAPTWEHPDLRTAFQDPGEDQRTFMDHPVNADAFQEALRERHTTPLHQVGGYADPVQGPVEFEVAQAALSQLPWDDPRLESEAARWELLFQVDTEDDLDMMWGDVGVLYWMARPEDLDRGDLTRTSFTWQCG